MSHKFLAPRPHHRGSGGVVDPEKFNPHLMWSSLVALLHLGICWGLKNLWALVVRPLKLREHV